MLPLEKYFQTCAHFLPVEKDECTIVSISTQNLFDWQKLVSRELQNINLLSYENDN